MTTTGSSSSQGTPEGTRAATDIVVGLTAHGLAGTDPRAIVHALGASQARHGPSLRWRIVVAEPGSDSGAVERMREVMAADGDLAAVRYALQPSDSLEVPYHGLAGRARAVHAILEDAQAQQARGCVLLDPRSVVPAVALEHLVQPLIADAADYVAPAYSRHPFTGALVHGVIYPTFRALYGVRLHYPLAADFACSRRLIEAMLADPMWQTDSGQLGIDLWMAATAVSSGFRVGEAHLGRRLDERAGLDLGTTVSQVVGFLFTDMERRAAVWQRIRGSRALPQFGTASPSPDSPEVDAAPLADSFRLGTRELQDVWAEVLPPLSLLQWRRLARAPLDAFRVEDALWARTVYDFAMGHRLRVIARDHLLRALTPLYLGWLASFVVEMRRARPPQAEARLERLCLAFEAEKPYLISQWRWPERFRPVKLRR
jgi:glucosylglycerate synthase